MASISPDVSLRIARPGGDEILRPEPVHQTPLPETLLRRPRRRRLQAWPRRRKGCCAPLSPSPHSAFTPPSAMRISRFFFDAFTRSSAASVSQSVISEPFGWMCRPTLRWLPSSFGAEGATAPELAGLAASHNTRFILLEPVWEGLGRMNFLNMGMDPSMSLFAKTSQCDYSRELNA